MIPPEMMNLTLNWTAPEPNPKPFPKPYQSLAKLKSVSLLRIGNSRALDGDRVTSHLQFEPEIVLKMISYCNH